jgi:hypothetical protein
MTVKVTNWKSLIIATLASGLGMWIVGGLWHNLILPSVNSKVEAHHEGIGIMLIAYFCLSFLMVYLYLQINNSTYTVFNGLKLGVIIGILWVFPHGLAMAGTHETSILYEFENTLYHIFEQGVGGIIISSVFGYFTKKQ